MAKKDKKYYWLQLKKDFFKRHDIQIVEGMPNGKDYILFYLKLLCESVDHDGSLRFNDQIPYNEQMLSTITNTNVDVVKSAIEIFTQLKMMEVMDDGTYYLHEVQRMMGSESYWAEKKRTQRAEIGQCPTLSNSSPTCPSKIKSKSNIKSNIKNIAQIDCAVSFDVDNAFNSFWKVYPRRVGKSKAQEKFKKICKDKKTFDLIMVGLNNQLTCSQWTKDNGQFIPHPTTWLNGNRWEDEVQIFIDPTQKQLPIWYHDQSDMKPDHEFNEIELEQNLKKLRGEENET